MSHNITEFDDIFVNSFRCFWKHDYPMDSLSRELFSTYGIDIASMSLYIDLIWNHMLLISLHSADIKCATLSQAWDIRAKQNFHHYQASPVYEMK